MAILASIVHVSSHTKRLSLSNQKCTTQPTIINLYPNEYTQGLRYYPLLLIYIDVFMKVVILLMTCLIKYVFQTKPKI